MEKTMQNKYIIIPIFFVLLINTIFAVTQGCWRDVICESSGTMSNGMIITVDYSNESVKKEEYCILDDITVEASSTGFIEIVIHQGQYQGGNSETKRIVLERNYYEIGNGIVFKLSKDTSPTTIICNEIMPTSGPGAPYTITKTLNYFSLSYDQQWYENQAGMPLNYLSDYKNNIEIKGLPIISVDGELKISDTNISKTYQNIPADTTNWFMYGVAWLFILIGLLIIFSTVIDYTKRSK